MENEKWGREGGGIKNGKCRNGCGATAGPAKMKNGD